MCALEITNFFGLYLYKIISLNVSFIYVLFLLPLYTQNVHSIEAVFSLPCKIIPNTIFTFIISLFKCDWRWSFYELYIVKEVFHCISLSKKHFVSEGEFDFNIAHLTRSWNKFSHLLNYKHLQYASWTHQNWCHVNK